MHQTVASKENKISRGFRTHKTLFPPLNRGQEI